MNNKVCCLTCKNLCINEYVVPAEDDKMAYSFSCMVTEKQMTWGDLEDFFCSVHSNQEAIKLMREAVQ
jgi:hypothetical protein